MSTDRPISLAPDIAGDLIAMRRHLHMYPELSNEERSTQSYLLERIAAEGIEGAIQAAGTGIVVDISGNRKRSNRCIAVRADIDALPIHEDTGLSFSSRVDGVMHACGHDAHTAMVFAAMRALHRARDSYSGTVRFIFQPAEEAEPLGGRRIVEEGYLEGVEAAIGVHVDPYLETGKIAVGDGPYTLASDIFDITVSGVAAHAAKPYEGVDALGIGCRIVSELDRIVSRETGPFDALVLSITRFQAGQSYNVLADRAVISGTLRSGHNTLRTRGLRRIEEVAKGIAAAHGASAEVRIVRGEPPVVNDPAIVRVVCDAVGEALGEAAVVIAPGWEAADDFGFYSQKVPSVYFRLGVRDPALDRAYPLHHPRMNVDENALEPGAKALIAVAIKALDGPARS